MPGVSHTTVEHDGLGELTARDTGEDLSQEPTRCAVLQTRLSWVADALRSSPPHHPEKKPEDTKGESLARIRAGGRVK